MLSRPCQFVTTRAKSSSWEDSGPLCTCGARIWTVRRDSRPVCEKRGLDLAAWQEIVATTACGAELDRAAEAGFAGTLTYKPRGIR